MLPDRPHRSIPRRWRYTLILLFTAFFFLPLATAIVALSYLYTHLSNLSIRRNRQQLGRNPSRALRILITGASTPAALTLSRLLHASGHKIVAADYEPIPFLSPARASKTISKFYRLSKVRSATNTSGNKKNEHANITLFGNIVRSAPHHACYQTSAEEVYTSDIEAIIQHNSGIDLWIPCDIPIATPSKSLTAAREVVVGFGGRVVYPDTAAVRICTDKIKFAEFVDGLGMGWKVPLRREVRSRGEIHRVLNGCPKGRRYLLEQLQQEQEQEADADADADDALDIFLADTDTKRDSGISMSLETTSPSPSLQCISGDYYSHSTTLPRPTMNETYNAVAALCISERQPWLMQEVGEGEGSVVIASALVVDGLVGIFVAGTAMNALPTAASDFVISSTISSLLFSGEVEREDGYMAISPASALHSVLQSFTADFAKALPGGKTTTHLTLRFRVEDGRSPIGIAQVIKPISCSLAAHPLLAVLAEYRNPDQASDVVAAYVSAVTDSTTNHTTNGTTTPVTLHLSSSYSSLYNQSSPRGLYSLPQTLTTHLVLPILRLRHLRGSPIEVLEGTITTLQRLLFWKEELFDVRDPWVWWWAWFVSMPVQEAAEMAGWW